MPGTRCLFSNGWRPTPSAETTGATVLWLKWIAISLIVPVQLTRLKRGKRISSVIAGRNFYCRDALEHSRMHTKNRFSRWLKAAAVLAVAECAGMAVVQAQSSGDFYQFDGSHVRYDKYRKGWFDPLGWERQRRKVHRRSDSSRTSESRQNRSLSRASRRLQKRLSGLRALRSKTFRCRDRGRQSGRSLTPLPKRQAPVSIARVSPAP
jgi:hypothetical protein